MPPNQPDHWIRRLRKYLVADLGLSPKTLSLYEPLIRVFLSYPGERNISLEMATEADLKNYLRWQRRRYRKLHGREPGNLRSWRIHHAVPSRHLLRVAQGKWPPASPGDELFGRYQEHLIEQGLQLSKEYRRPARLFTDYLGEHDLDASKVQPSDVAEFLRVALTLARRHRPTRITQPSSWNRVMRRTVHAILRFAQGEWPPGSNPSPVVNTFRQYLVRHQYNHTVVVTAVAAVNQFLRHLQRGGKDQKRRALPMSIHLSRRSDDNMKSAMAVHRRVKAAGDPGIPAPSIECCVSLTQHGHVQSRRAMKLSAFDAT